MFGPWAPGDNQQLLLVPVQLEGYGISARDKYIMWLIASPWRKSLSSSVFRILCIPWEMSVDVILLLSSELPPLLWI
jgi:hypothetical protein